ncbi:hypothetical protein VUR80DRAFT_9958 [Thermomyces stellatus]
MPSLTSPLPPPSKKRRLSDADDTHAQPFPILPSPLWDKPETRWEKPSELFLQQRRPPFRKVAPLPPAKRARAEGDRRRTRSPGAVKDGNAKGKTCLAPCHICHRRPTKKSDLDSFADCEGCGERTCFICMRNCIGPLVQEAKQEGEGEMCEQQALSRSFCMDDADGPLAEQQQDEGEQRDKGDGEGEKWWAGGHRGVICSRCCVEMGPDGDIACLGCLSRMETV